METMMTSCVECGGDVEATVNAVMAHIREEHPDSELLRWHDNMRERLAEMEDLDRVVKGLIEDSLESVAVPVEDPD